jgi:putative DNA primase/helicase
MSSAIIIPPCLAEQTKETRWLVWKWVNGPNGRRTKPPFRANDPSVLAKTNDPQTWASCEAAMQTCASGRADGLGYAMMGSGIAALDCDNCRDPESGVLAPWAQQLLGRSNTYAEVTPSKRGIRIIGKASGDKLHRKLPAPDGGSVEVYRGAVERYITISGDSLTPGIDQLGDIDVLCDQVVAEFDKKPPPQQPAPGGDDRSLEDLIQNGCGTSFGGDKSRAVWRVINLMLERGDDRDKIARVLVNPANGISTHCLSRPDDPTAYALRQIDKAISARAEDDEAAGEVARLAKLPPLKYEKERTLAAEELGIRASALDKLVSEKRAEVGSDFTTKQGKPIEFPKIEPWHEEVNGAALLDEIVRELGRYMVMSDADKTIAAIWPIHAHVYNRFLVTPRLCVRSPVKECGKTTLFSVISHLVPRALMTASVTPAVLFRMIELHRVTLLIDEAAAMFDEAGEMRRILNCGYRSDGAVMRCVGDSFEPRLFKVFGPVAFALIGTLPSDLHSRCICVNLRRKLAGEKVEPDRIGQMQHLKALARKIVRWTNDNADAIANANPELPADVINRRGDLWVPMLSIATVAGGDWPTRVERAIAATAETGDDDDATQLEKALVDIDKVFAEKGEEEVSSDALTGTMVDMLGRPWGEMGKSRKPLTPAKLARMLRVPGVSVSPVQIKGGKLRGYKRSQFDDIFARYLPTSPLSKCQSVVDPMKTEGTDTSQSVCESVCDVSEVSEVSATDTLSPSHDTSIDAMCNAINPMKIGVYDTMTLPRGGKCTPIAGDAGTCPYSAVDRLVSETGQGPAGRDEPGHPAGSPQAKAARNAGRGAGGGPCRRHGRPDREGGYPQEAGSKEEVAMTISVTINGIDLFEWDLDAEDVAFLKEGMGEVARCGPPTPAELAGSAVAHVLEHGDFGSEAWWMQPALTRMLLSQATGHPDRPGVFCDYIEVWASISTSAATSGRRSRLRSADECSAAAIGSV